MTDTTMVNFIGLSSVLTGFSNSILSPGLDPVDIKSEYLSFFTKAVADESGDASLVDSILQTFTSLKKQGLTDQKIGETMLSPENGDAFVLACQKLIFMWYSGAWPTLIPATNSAPATTVSNLISAKSYTAGLVWQVMQSHPMGDSNYRYGYWASAPAELNAYTGGGK